MQATNDATYPLRPRGVFELVDLTFNLYRNNFALFAGVVAVLSIPETVISMIIAGTRPSTSALTTSGNSVNYHQIASAYGTAGALSGLTGFIGFLFGLFITAALARAVSDRYLGRPQTILGTYRDTGLSPFLRLLAATILGIIAVILVSAILIGVSIALVAVTSGVTRGIAITVLVLGGILAVLAG